MLREVDMASFLHMWGSIAMLSPLSEVRLGIVIPESIFAWIFFGGGAAKGLWYVYMSFSFFSPLFERNIIEFWWELSGICRLLLEQEKVLLQVFSLAFPFV